MELQYLQKFLEKKHSCIVCDGNEFLNWAEQDYLRALKCVQCGMISINPHFSEEGLSIFYRDYYQNRMLNVEMSAMRQDAYRIDYNWILNYKPGGKVLDVGCSDGSFLSYFDSKLWNRYGIDLTKDALQIASGKHGIRTYRGNIWETDVGRDFDLVMMRGVIEHFKNPISVLDKCLDILKPGGLLYITATPAGDSFAFATYREKWRLFTPYEHIHFFTVKILTFLIEQRGGKYVSHHYQYEETPYANPELDYKKISDDIVAMATHGSRVGVEISGPFPGSMLTATWKKL